MASFTYELAELGDDTHGLGCKCCRFKQGLDLPIPAKLTIEEIKQHGLRFSTAIISDWTKLNAILKRLQAVIEKRWLKKNTKQRREILLRAWPEMAAGHRPDFASFRQTAKMAPRSRTCPSAAYLWPYINLEDLQQHHPLLLFLDSRGRNLPELFMAADIDAAHLGHGWDFSRCDNSSCGNHCTEAMHFFGHAQRSPRAYGRITGMWDDLPVAGSVPKSTIRYHPSLGLLGLEIQAGIYSFLVKCAKLILHDVSMSQYFIAPHQPAPPPLQLKLRSFRTLQDHALEAPYRMPHNNFDLARFTQLVAARRASAEDHIWMLREDPGYFTEALKEEREHTVEYSHDCPGTWQKVAEMVITDAVTYFLFWDDIHRRLKKMPALEIQLGRADHNVVRLFPADERMWAELETILNLMQVIPLSRLRIGFPVSPRMRHCYPMHAKRNASSKDKWSYKSTRNEAESRADLVFYALTEGEQRSLHSLHHLVQEAQYMLDTEPGANELIDSWLAGHFADLALISELKLRIESLQPWCNTWRESGVLDAVQESDSVTKLLDLDTTFRGAIILACMEADPGDPNSTCWRYPADKRPSKATITQMRNAELCLDDYWHLLESWVFLEAKKDLMKALARRGLSRRVLVRTQPWKEPIILHSETLPAPQPVLRELSTNTPSARGLCEPITTPKKHKIKTRGASTPAATQDGAVDAATVVDESSLTVVKVPKRVYKVLSTLFPLPGADNHQRLEVAWDELLYAMNAIGLQPEKLYGSVWIFRPGILTDCKVELDLKRSIQFHEPKEVRRGGKIPPNMVRTFGRRMRYAFGWEPGMFECE